MVGFIVANGDLGLAGAVANRGSDDGHLGILGEPLAQDPHTCALRLDRDHPSVHLAQHLGPVPDVGTDVEAKAPGGDQGAIESHPASVLLGGPAAKAPLEIGATLWCLLKRLSG